MMRTVFLLALLVATADALSGSEAIEQVREMSQLLRIQSEVGALSPELPVGHGVVEPAGADVHAHEVTSLGDGAPKATVDDELVELQGVVSAFTVVSTDSNGEVIGVELGEEQDASADVIDKKALSNLMIVQGDEDSDKAVHRVLNFLKKQQDNGAQMSMDELDKVRQFYIDQTATVLARFGYEDSEYGEHDVKDRRGDALAARKHLEGEDVQLKLDQEGMEHTGTPEDSGMSSKVLTYLQQTARLSEYLEKVIDLRDDEKDAKLMAVPEDDDSDEVLEHLEHDEDKIEQGISELLEVVKQADHAMPPIPDKKDESTPPTKLPLPRVEENLRGVISTQIDETLQQLENMQAEGQTITPATKGELNRYLHFITGRLMKSYLSYEDWTDQDAMETEERALAAGDAEAPSRIQGGQKMSEKNILDHFLGKTWRPPVTQQVPPAVADFSTNSAIALPGGGHVVIVMPNGHY